MKSKRPLLPRGACVGRTTGREEFKITRGVDVQPKPDGRRTAPMTRPSPRAHHAVRIHRLEHLPAIESLHLATHRRRPVSCAQCARNKCGGNLHEQSTNMVGTTSSHVEFGARHTRSHHAPAHTTPDPSLRAHSLPVHHIMRVLTDRLLVCLSERRYIPVARRAQPPTCAGLTAVQVACRARLSYRPAAARSASASAHSARSAARRTHRQLAPLGHMRA